MNIILELVLISALPYCLIFLFSRIRRNPVIETLQNNECIWGLGEDDKQCENSTHYMVQNFIKAHRLNTMELHAILGIQSN